MTEIDGIGDGASAPVSRPDEARRRDTAKPKLGARVKWLLIRRLYPRSKVCSFKQHYEMSLNL
jgi:hypothetical protein